MESAKAVSKAPSAFVERLEAVIDCWVPLLPVDLQERFPARLPAVRRRA